MADLRKYTAVKKTRASIGKSVGATTLDVAAIQDRLGNTLTMTNFGSKGFGVVSPRKSNERQFVFTGITGSQVTGISEVTMDGSNTESSGWSRAIIAGEEVVLMTNSPAFYNEFPNVNNDNTFVGKQLFTTAERPALTTDSDTSTAEDLITYGQLSRTAIAGGVNASTTVQGLVELGTATEVDAGTATGGTGAALAVTPDKLRARRYLGYYVDSGANDTYAVTGVSATLAAGDHIIVNINTANTGAATLSVDGGSNIAIVKDKSVALETGDLAADQIISLIYDGTNWQLISPVAQMSAANKALLTGGSTTNADAAHTHDYNTLYAIANSGSTIIHDIPLILGGAHGFGVIDTGTSDYAEYAGEISFNSGTSGASDASGFYSVSRTGGSGSGSKDPILSGLTMDEEFTVELLCRIPSASSSNIYIGFDNESAGTIPTTNRHFAFYKNGATVYAECADGTTRNRDDITAEITLGQWNHLKIVRGASDIKFYVNNTLVSTLSSNLPTSQDAELHVINQNTDTGSDALRVNRRIIMTTTRTF